MVKGSHDRSFSYLNCFSICVQDAERFPVVGYDKHLAVIRRNMESPIGWPYYHKSVMGDGSLTDLRGRVSALDIQDNLETNEKRRTDPLK